MASDNPKVKIHTSFAPYSQAPRRHPRIKTRLSFQDRLLRNSCLACAVLLGILALGNLRQPWAIKAAQGIEQALTMKVDLDESLGQLTFVKKLMPESALVFFNLSGKHEFAQIVQGKLAHAYDEAQPWLMFECEADSGVCSPADGIISAISTLSDGKLGVLIDHGNGLESVIANLSNVSLHSGDEVMRGGVIGSSCESLYYELRQGGTSIDPTERMGL